MRWAVLIVRMNEMRNASHIRRQSCRCKDSLIRKMKTQNSFGTSSDTASITRNLNLQQNRWQNLISPRIILNYILQKHGVNCMELARNNCQRWAAVTTHMSPSMPSACITRQFVRVPLRPNFRHFGYTPDGRKPINFH